jgi:hypothetical protein
MTRSVDGAVEYIPDRNCPDVYRLSWWRRGLKRFAPRFAALFRIDIEPRMVAYRMGNRVYCSYRTYAAFVDAGIVPSPPLNFQMPRRPDQNATAAEAVH